MAEFVSDVREDLGHTILAVRYELRKHFRRTRILIALLLATVIPFLFWVIPVLQNSDFPATSVSFISQLLGFIYLLVIISAAMFAGDAVCGEFESRTALMTLSSPQRRTSIFVGKYLAALLMVIAIVSVYYLVGVLEIAGVYGMSDVPVETLRSFLFTVLFASAVVSLTFFFSAVIKGVMAATLLSFFGLMMILPIVSALLTVAGVDPWFIVTFYSDLITGVFAQPSPYGDGGGPPEGIFGASPDFGTGVAVVAAYAIVLFLVGLIVAVRKDVE